MAFSGQLLVDIGVNLTNRRFDKDRGEVLERALRAGVAHCMVTGTCVESSAAAIALCRVYNQTLPGMLSATAGVHPHDASGLDRGATARLRQLIGDNSDVVVAVGETGLDFNRNFSSPQSQIAAFECQLALARECALPLFLHERDAHDTQLGILRAQGGDLPRGVIHCFTGNRRELYNYLDLGLYIGITGWICDERRGQELQQLVADIPLDRLLVESDAPYLLPRTLKPRPKNNRNEPAYLPEVVATVAACRGQSLAVIATASRDNARRLFNLPPPASPRDARGDA